MIELAAPVLYTGRVALVFATLVGIGVATAVLPALRAIRIDPAIALLANV